MINLYPPERSFQHFKQKILEWKFEAPDMSLLMNREKNLYEFYTPFDYVNENAKVMLVGLTPGLTQWKEAINYARHGIVCKYDDEYILRRTKSHCAFAGKEMRHLLLKSLHFIKLHEHLKIDSCEDLFGCHNNLAHMTSCLVNATLKSNVNKLENFRDRINNKYKPYFDKSLQNGLLLELKAVPNAVVIPLGFSANELFENLVANNIIEKDRVVLGVPHPSGLNRERCMRFFWDGKDGLDFNKPSGTKGLKTPEDRKEYYEKALKVREDLKNAFS